VYGAGVPAPPNLEVADLRFPSNKQNTAAGTSPLRSSPLSPFSAAAAKTQDAAPANNLLKQQVLQRDQAAHKKRALTGTLGRSVIKPAAGAGAKQPADSVPKDPRSLMLQTVRDALPAKSRALLDQLGSKLDDRDLSVPGGGRTTLELLHDLAVKGPDAEALKAGLTSARMLPQLIEQLANPGLIHQSLFGTCAATTVQYYLATNHPAEYARMTVDLLSKGTFQTSSGVVYARDPGSLAIDAAGTRKDIDRILQTTIMDQEDAHGIVKGSYDPRTDKHANGVSGMHTVTISRVMSELAATTGQATYYDNPYKYDAEARKYVVDAAGKLIQDPEKVTRLLDNIKGWLDKGTETYVALKWDISGQSIHGYHALLVTKVEGDYIHLRNPWGKDETKTMVDRGMGPAREILDDQGNVRMKLSDFTAVLESAAMPYQVAAAGNQV